VRQREDRFKLVLIDNGSTDGGAAEARLHAAPLGDRAILIDCSIPGKTNAMAAGLDQVSTPLVAICDADTMYPPDYVAHIFELFDKHSDAAAVMALDLYAPPDSVLSRKRIEFLMKKTKRFPGKCHAGGYAQAFRTKALCDAGGFDPARWPFVLEDHEIVHRVMFHGRVVYDPTHVCFPSDRRIRRNSTSWTRAERLLYRYVPSSALDWYFYSFLAPRLADRNCLTVVLRHKDWLSNAT